MAQNPLALKEADVKLMLVANTHLGTKKKNFDMKRYIWRRRIDGVFLINIGKTWEKLMLAARIIVAVENPEDVVVISSRQIGQRAVFKFSQYVGSSYIGGRYTPGTFTNQKQKKFLEPRVLLVTDPISDSQPIREASYVNITTIAFCNTDCGLKFVDCAIPCNNIGKHSIALMYWLLGREILRLRSHISRAEPWDVMVDLFMHRDPEEVEELKAAKDEADEENQMTQVLPTDTADQGDMVEWGAPDGETPAAGDEWAAQTDTGQTTQVPAGQGYQEMAQPVAAGYQDTQVDTQQVEHTQVPVHYEQSVDQVQDVPIQQYQQPVDQSYQQEYQQPADQQYQPPQQQYQQPPPQMPPTMAPPSAMPPQTMAPPPQMAPPQGMPPPQGLPPQGVPPVQQYQPPQPMQPMQPQPPMQQQWEPQAPAESWDQQQQYQQ